MPSVAFKAYPGFLQATLSLSCTAVDTSSTGDVKRHNDAIACLPITNIASEGNNNTCCFVPENTRQTPEGLPAV
jgi:hypothetical protein